MGPDDERLTLLGRRLPGWTVAHVVCLAPGERRVLALDDWRDGLVVVEVGHVTVEGRSGHRRSFDTGAVLWLAGLPLAALCNDGDHDAVLVAVSRRSSAGRSPGRAPPGCDVSGA